MRTNQVQLLRQEYRDGCIWEGGMFYTRADVLDVACSLFCERGYRGTTVRDIAKTLDLRSGSLYTHFHSKEEMLWEIIDRLANLFLAQASFVPQHLSFEEQLVQFIRGHLDVIAREQRSAVIFFRDAIFLPAEKREQLQKKREVYEAYFYDVLASGQQSGEFQCADVRLAALFMLSALNGTHQWLIWEEPVVLERVKKQYEGFLLRALKGGE